MVAEGRGSSPNGNITIVNIHRDVENITNYGSHSSQTQQEGVPVHLNGVDLEEYLKNQGCVIQRSAKSSTNSFLLNENIFNSKKETFTKHICRDAPEGRKTGESALTNKRNQPERGIKTLISDDYIDCNKRSTGTETRLVNDANGVPEKVAKMILQKRESFRCERNNVTVNKGIIVDQNVGVTGEVLMVTPCNSPNTSLAPFTEQATRHSPTVVYIGAIEEKDVNELLKSVDIVETVEEIESGPNSLTLSYYEPIKCEKLHCSQDYPESAAGDSDYRHLLHVVDKPLTSPALLLQWRVRPPDDGLRDEDNSSPITPSSSMFSSAYTVTELGSDNSSDRSPPSEYSHSSRRIFEADDVTNREDLQDARFQEYLQLFRQLTSVNQALLLGGLEAATIDECVENQSFCNGLHREGSRRSIIFNYISPKDEKEKEEEELWVANEAAYCSQDHQDRIPDQFKISCVPAVSLVVNQKVPEFVVPEGQNLSYRTETSRLSPVSTVSASTQTIYSCLLPPLNYYSVPKRSDRSRNSSAGADAQAPSVGNDTSASAGGEKEEQMAALICPAASTERRHFSARQRYVENDAKKTECMNKEITLENVGSRSCSNTATKENSQHLSSPVTSSATQQPTKRFSFLIRSSSMDQQEVVKLNTPISASDKAILARLEELKVNQVKETPAGKKASSSLHPPCRRCNEPVYPQERLQPSKEMIFHTSCFKCSQCGVRLNLKTFFRNPLTLKDYRIFCKSHVPTLDPGKVALEKKILPESTNENTPASCRVSSVTIASHPSASVDRVVVKGDTQGLRYF